MARLIIRTLIEDIKNFSNIIPHRTEVINSSEKKPLPSVYKTNELADKLHPQKQEAIVSSIVLLNNKTKLLTLTCKNGCFSFFRAGQGVNIQKDSFSEFFPIMSSPTEDVYKIIVFRNEASKVTDYLYSLKEGDLIEVSGPYGFFYYSSIRDSKNIAFVCDYTGVAPVISICKNLTEIVSDVSIKLFYSDVDKVCDLRNLVSLPENVTVYSVADVTDVKNGLIDINEETSFFISGKNSFCEAIKSVTEKSDVCKGKPRIFVSDPVQKADNDGELHTCKILYRDKVFMIECSEQETLLTAFEKNNIPCQAKCKIGECGYCRCQLIEGKTETVNCADISSVRSADEKYGFIHPCRTFPRSDMIILI